MDFLDPKKQRANSIRLIVGYVLVAIAIVLTTVALIYAEYGYTLKNGKIIQNGLIFVSSHPGGSTITLNGRPTGKTNTRLTLAAGTYMLQIQRNGYRTWQRAITVEGDSVERFDYPFLFPTALQSTIVPSSTTAPLDASQSPNRRWLVLESSAAGTFSLYDLNSPAKAAVTISLPAGTLTAPSTSAAQTLKTVEWSNDNRHVLLKHTYGSAYEYILLDTQNPAQSLNLNRTLQVTPTELSLQNKQYNHYFVYNATLKLLTTATLSSTTQTPLLQDVLAYKTYGSNVVLYATDKNAPAGQVLIMLHQNGREYHLRNVSKGASVASYLLDLTQYSGSWYVVAGSSSENRVYVYQNPLEQLSADGNTALVPVTVLKLTSPTYVDFSGSAQFIVAENGTNFAVYDIQYDQNYSYMLKSPLDKPQTHAAWMDGDRLEYISGGSLVVFDYDDANRQTLMPASPAFTPFFDPNYKFVYALASSPATPKAPAETHLTSTALLTPADK